MEKLDQDLVAYAKSALTASDIARVGVQILDGLQWMHDKGFVFVDVKPANFMLKGEKLYFVDYGLVERLQVNAVGAFQGTPAFCSLAALGGAKAGAHDDLEAMALVLLSLASGASLPWSQAPTEAACAKMKTDCDIGALCSAANCRELADIILYCQALDRVTRPDYGKIKGLLLKMQARKTAVPTKASSKSAPAPAPAPTPKPASKASKAPAPAPAPKSKASKPAKKAPPAEEEEPAPKRRAPSAPAPAPTSGSQAASISTSASAAASSPYTPAAKKRRSGGGISSGGVGSSGGSEGDRRSERIRSGPFTAAYRK